MKKIIMVTLVSALIVILFVGCGNTNTLKFEKTEKEIQNDLIKNGTGFMELALSAHTFSFLETDSYKINQINEFKILSIEPDKESILNLTNVIISTNTDFTIKNQNDVSYENGSYNINGKFKVVYKLDKDEKGNPAWVFYTPRLTTFLESKVTKK